MKKTINDLKNEMFKKYELNDLGLLNCFLDIKIEQTNDGIFISQEIYAQNILSKFKMKNCNPVTTSILVNEKLIKKDACGDANDFFYRSLIGSLLYFVINRPDNMYVTGLLSRYMSKPSKIHLGVEKKVLRYIQDIKNYGLMYEKNKNTKIELFRFCDSNWVGSADDMRNTSGYRVYSHGPRENKKGLRFPPRKPNMCQQTKS